MRTGTYSFVTTFAVRFVFVHCLFWFRFWLNILENTTLPCCSTSNEQFGQNHSLYPTTCHKIIDYTKLLKPPGKYFIKHFVFDIYFSGIGLCVTGPFYLKTDILLSQQSEKMYCYTLILRLQQYTNIIIIHKIFNLCSVHRLSHCYRSS